MGEVKQRTVAKLVIFAGLGIFCFLVMEIGVRVLIQRDEDGNCIFRGLQLKPYKPTVHRAERIVKEYLKKDDSLLIYDSQLGWALRPDVDNQNAYGFITARPEVKEVPAPGCLRIALFGGSYTEGTFDHGWWRVLEQELNAAGIKAEVLNFGVAGYGMDQAYLHWKRDGVKYHPDVVMFGFSAGNCRDNLSLLRMVKDIGSMIPFSKPRFVLTGDQLELVGSPTPPPEAMAGILAHLQDWPEIRYEPYYHAEDFEMKPWRYSRLAATLEAKMCAIRNKPLSPEFYQFEEMPAQLGLAIVRRFAAEVTASGATFCTLHLPHHIELAYYQKHGRFAYQRLLDAVDALAPMAHAEGALLEKCAGHPPEQLYVDGHMNEQMQMVAGRVTAEFIRPHAGEWLRH